MANASKSFRKTLAGLIVSALLATGNQTRPVEFRVEDVSATVVAGGKE